MSFPEANPRSQHVTPGRGKLAVLTMFALAFLAAGFAWWWNYQRGHRCLEFYGSEAALMIRTAPQVELLQLAPEVSASENQAGEVLQVGDMRLRLARRIDISQAKGLIHARASIVDDTSFHWDAEPDCHPQLPFAVRFSDGNSQITLAYDFGCQRVWVVESQRKATLIRKVAQGWQSFLTRQAELATSSP